jgi:hypothetical protein
VDAVSSELSDLLLTSTQQHNDSTQVDQLVLLRPCVHCNQGEGDSAPAVWQRRHCEAAPTRTFVQDKLEWASKDVGRGTHRRHLRSDQCLTLREPLTLDRALATSSSSLTSHVSSSRSRSLIHQLCKVHATFTTFCTFAMRTRSGDLNIRDLFTRYPKAISTRIRSWLKWKLKASR